MSDIPRDFPEQLWRGLVPHLGTMNRHVSIALHNEFVVMLREDVRTVVRLEQSAPGQIGIGLQGHVIEAFKRMAAELRLTPNPMASKRRLGVHLEDVPSVGESVQ